MSDMENFEKKMLSKERSMDLEDDLDMDEYDYDDDDYWEYYDDWLEERREEELLERAAYCTCGAWQNGPNGVVHVADCFCGAE